MLTIAAHVALATLPAGAASPTASLAPLVDAGWAALRRGDCGTARQLFETAAAPDGGSARARDSLGYLYATGKCGPIDRPRAIELFRQAAAAGDINAAFNLGVNALQEGDPATAFAGMRQAAEAGRPSAEAFLGEYYRFGTGVAVDPVAALAWYRKAAEHGDALGERMMGYAASTGFGGEPIDLQAAERWYRRAAQKGNPDANHELGLMRVEGGLLPIDYAEAVQWFRRAADLGSPEGFGALGYSLERGHGTAKDIQAAILWHKRAAEYGIPNAMHNLARIYAEGDGVAADPDAAVYWGLLAARFYSPGPKLEGVRALIGPLVDALPLATWDAIQAKVDAFQPRRRPSFDVSEPDAPAKPRTVRELLREDRHFFFYAVLFEFVVDAGGDVLSIKPIQVIDPAAGNLDPLDVVVPDNFREAVRGRLGAKPPKGIKPGQKGAYRASYYFAPRYPTTIFTDLDALPEKQPLEFRLAP